MANKEYFELLILGSNPLVTLRVRTFLCKCVGTIVYVHMHAMFMEVTRGYWAPRNPNTWVLTNKLRLHENKHSHPT